MRRRNNGTIFIDRNGGIIYAEFILCAIVLAIITVKVFTLAWAIGVVLFLPYVFLLDWLFFKVFIWRWLFSTVMSAGWGYFAFRLTTFLSGADKNAWIMGIAVFIFMLWAHRDDYKFESTAKVRLFDYLGRD